MDWKKKLKFVAIFAAFAVLILIVLTNVFKTTRVSEKDFSTYAQGLEYVEKEDFENAYFNFSNVSKNSAIYEIALLRQALCADSLKDSDTAVKKYRMFVEKYPYSVFAPKAYYALAQNYFRANDFSKAEKTFSGIKKDYKDTDYAIASDYYLGLIYKQKDSVLDKTKAKQSFVQYLENAPNGRFALTSAEAVLELQKEFNVILTSKDYFLLGRTFFKNGYFKSAEENLNKSNIADAWAYLSEISRKSGNYQTARNLFEANYSAYASNLAAEDLNNFLDNYAVAYPEGAKAGYYKLYEIAQAQRSTAGGDYVLYKLSKLESAENAKNIYELIYKNYPNGDYASDAVAKLFWLAYKAGNLNEAYSWGSIHVRTYQNTKDAPRILYWMARLSAQLRKGNEASGFYQRILENYPDDYYAFRAHKQLNNTHNNGWKTKSSHKLPEKTAVVTLPVKYTKFNDDNLTLVNAILKLKDFDLLLEAEPENKVVKSYVNYKKGKPSTAALFARDAIAEMDTKPKFSDNIYKLAYPLHYQEYINLYSKQYKLDPFLIAALIREESYYNPEAGSSVGARGLMQLMPATASFIAGKNGISYAGSSILTVPEKNIELGCAYFDYAKEKMYEDDLLAVASYNGGPNAVLQWKNRNDYKNFDEFIENIPYPETRDYVKKVYRSYWVYLNLY